MAFENETNPKRVSKIIEFLDLIEHSAQANNKGPDDIKQMIQPAIAR